MEVKEAIQKAKEYITELFASEKVQWGVGLEGAEQEKNLNCKRLVLTMVSIGIFSVLAACGGSANEVTTNSTPAATPEWYEGGTLHRATIADWKSATARNQLATSADFVITSGQYQSLPPDLRDRAVQFEECISTATQGIAAVDTSLVSEIAAACGVLLQYRR